MKIAILFFIFCALWFCMDALINLRTSLKWMEYEAPLTKKEIEFMSEDIFNKLFLK